MPAWICFLCICLFVFFGSALLLKTIPTPCTGATRTHTHLFNHKAERKHTHRAHMNTHSGSLRWACLSHSEAPGGNGALTCDKVQMGSQQFVAPSLHLAAISALPRLFLCFVDPYFLSFFYLATCYLLPGGHRWTASSPDKCGRNFVQVCKKARPNVDLTPRHLSR